MLAVVAHPDDESFGLGAILDAFHAAGAGLAVLCLTYGEASTVRGVGGDLADARSSEFTAAARVLGVTDAVIRNFGGRRAQSGLSRRALWRGDRCCSSCQR